MDLDGMLQNGTNWADGVPGISQCPIPAGKSFQYKFTVANQFGTYWYHSHMGNTMADGLQVGFLTLRNRSPLKPDDTARTGTSRHPQYQRSPRKRRRLQF